MSDINELLESEARATEADGADPLKPGTRVTRGHGRSKTLQVRLNEDEYGALETMAQARELPLSTMVRSIIIQSTRTGEAAAGDRRGLAELRGEVNDLLVKIAEIARHLDASLPAASSSKR